MMSQSLCFFFFLVKTYMPLNLLSFLLNASDYAFL